MTKPSITDHAAQVLAAGRRLFRERVLDGAALEAAGFDLNHGGACPRGDTRPLPLILAAARAPGWGEQPVDLRILEFCDSTWGAGQWRRGERPPHSHERFGGDAKLDA